MASTELLVDSQTLDHIVGVTGRHLRRLNEELTAAYADQPDEAITVAIASALTILFASCSDPAEKEHIASAINETLKVAHTPWRLVQTS